MLLVSRFHNIHIFSDLISSEHLSQSVVWVGMMNDYDGNRWTDGTPVAFLNWNDGEPNGYYSEECIGKW